jgi:hypothetical protein
MALISKSVPPDQKEELAIDQVRKALKGLRFGTVTLVVQDGVVIQVDRTSKSRIDYTALDQVAGGEGI